MRRLWFSIAGSMMAMSALAAETTAIRDITPREPPPPKPIEDRRLPGEKRVQDGATWNTELARQVYELCPAESFIEATESGAGINEADARQDGNCALHSLMVRNDSQRAIQCKATLDYAKADHANRVHLESEQVIFPFDERALLRSYANAANVPPAFAAECVALPEKPLPPLNFPADCKPRVSAPPPDEFYPPGAKRRNEQGRVVLEFTLNPDSIPTLVRVAESSGFVDLDNAALQYSKYVRAENSCPGARMRLGIRFSIKD
jgi:TonB family protein